MSTIRDILGRLETAHNPVAKAILKGNHFRVLALAFKKGMVMADHKTSMPAVLTVVSGRVHYVQNGVATTLLEFDEMPIPVNEVHSVEALEDSLCILCQGN